MNHEDTITLNAFLTALCRLETPLPVGLQEQLNAIAQDFPDSIRKLPRLVDQYEPLEEQYDIALDAIAANEGERFKFAAPQALETPTLDAAIAPAPDSLPESTVSWDEVERQVGSYFKEMALDVIEQYDPDYGRKTKEEILSDFKQAWHEAMTGQTIPVSQLWDDLEND